MDQKQDQPKPAPVMDVVAPPPSTEQPASSVSAEAANQSAADDPALDTSFATEPVAEPAPAPEQPPVAPAAPQPEPTQHQEQPRTPHASNPAMPIVIATIIVMVVLSGLAVFAYITTQ